MRFSLIFLILTLCFDSKANYELTVGGGPSAMKGFQSTEQSQIFQKPLIRSYGGGGINLEGTTDLFWNIDVIGNLMYLFESGKVQYSYVNQGNLADSGSMADLSTNLTYFDFRLGLRWSFLNFGSMSFFTGGGVSGGGLSFIFDEDEYRNANGFSDRGLKKEGDSAAIWGYFGDLGLQYSGQKMGFRVIASYSESKTSVFETLGGSRFSFDRMQASIIVFSKL